MTLSALAILVTLAAAATEAEPRIDASTPETMITSVKAIESSLSGDDYARFLIQLRLVMQDVLCPSDVEQPNMNTMLLKNDSLSRALNGTSAMDMLEMAAKVDFAKAAESASMRELPLGSEQARKIRAAVERFVAEAPEAATHYMEFSRFWSAARTETARKVVAAGAPTLFSDKWPAKDGKASPNFSADSREISATLMPDGWMKKVKVTRIFANDTKAYVDIEVFGVTRKMILLKEADDWKSHADFLGFPWSREGTSAPECVGVLQ